MTLPLPAQEKGRSVSATDHSLLKPNFGSLRYTRSIDSGLPSLSYASSSASDASPRLRAFSDAFSTDDNWDEARNISHETGDTSGSSGNRLMPQHALSNSRSLSRMLNQVKPAEAPQSPLLPTTIELSQLPEDKQFKHKRRRIRVESHPLSPSLGFPYRNSTNLLPDHRHPKGSSSSGFYGSDEDHRFSGTSSDDSSADVDLDLSWEPFRRADHIGIDMSTLSVDDQRAWPVSRGLATESPLLSGRSRCKSAGNFPLTIGAARPSLPSRPSSPILGPFISEQRRLSLPMDRSFDNLASTATWSTGWSYNKTMAIDSDQRAIVDQEMMDSNLRARRRGPISPLKFFFDKIGRSPPGSAASSPTVAASTPDLTDSRRHSVLSSPTNTDDVYTPRLVYGNLSQTPVEVLRDDDDQMFRSTSAHLSELGRQDLSKITNSTTFSTYATAQSIPFSLLSMVESESQRGTPAHGHTPKMESTDLTDFLEPAAGSVWDQPASPGLFGLGLDNVDSMSGQVPRLSPLLEGVARATARSPSPIASPSPNSPLLGSSSLPRVSFAEEQRRHLNDADSTWKSRISAMFSPGSRANVPATSRRSSAMSMSKFGTPTNWFDNVSPAKGLFFAGFFLGPWCWIYAALMLRPSDGEIANTHAVICRCPKRASPSLDLDCPADLHRILRLMGVRPTGKGMTVDMHQIADPDQLALLNIRPRSVDRFILVNQILAVGSSCLVVALFTAALYKVAIS